MGRDNERTCEKGRITTWTYIKKVGLMYEALRVKKKKQRTTTSGDVLPEQAVGTMRFRRSSPKGVSLIDLPTNR